MIQVSGWNFDPTSLGMLLIMAMSSESASVNLRVASYLIPCYAVLHYDVGTGTGMGGQAMAGSFCPTWCNYYTHLVRVLVSRLNSARLAVYSCDCLNSIYLNVDLSCSLPTCF